MSCNMKQKGTDKVLTGAGAVNPIMSKEEIDSVIDQALFENSYITDDCYRKIADILFEDRQPE